MPTSLIDRARAYVAKMPEAVAGQNGHGATFDVALVLVHFFELPRELALQVLTEYNERCAPPWSAKELNHKLESAQKSRWNGARARDTQRQPARPGRSEPSETRITRTGFPQSIKLPTVEDGQSRTVRIENLPYSPLRAPVQAHTGATMTGRKPSALSEPQTPPEPPPEPQRTETQPAPAQVDPPAPSSPDWTLARIEQGGDFRTRYARYVAADGTVRHAHITEANGLRTIALGRVLGIVGDGEVRG